MIDALKKNPAVIAALFLAYTAYGSLSLEQASAREEPDLPWIPEEVLSMRPRHSATMRMRDPVRSFASEEVEPEGRSWREVVVDAAGDLLEDAEALADDLPPWAPRLATAFEPSLGASLVLVTTEPPPGGWQPPGDPVRDGGPTFELHLDSVVSLGHGQGRVRINGRSASVGEALLGYDPRHPPVLRRVVGLRAEIEHRKRLYVLDLDGRPRATLGPESPDGIDLDEGLLELFR